jgi:hypothetical protein
MLRYSAFTFIFLLFINFHTTENLESLTINTGEIIPVSLTSLEDKPVIPEHIYDIVQSDNLIWLSDMSESVFSTKFNQYIWSDFKFTDGISSRGCSEKTWLLQYKTDIGGLSIEKCDDWIFIAAPASGGFAEMRNKSFTKLGNSLSNHRIGYENGLVLYRIVRTYRTYTIKVDWTNYAVFISPEK